MSDNQKKFQQILDSNLEFAQAKDVDLLLEKILSVARKLANADAGMIYLLNHEKLTFHHYQQETPKEERDFAKNTIYNGTSETITPDPISVHVAKTGTIVNIPRINDLSEDAPYTVNADIYRDLLSPLQAIVAFPLLNDYGTVLGVVQVLNPRDEAGTIMPPSEDDTPLIQLFANNAASAIERAQSTRARVLGIIQILTALRDTEETVSHVNRVGAYAAEIYDAWARRKGITQDVISSQKDLLRMAAMLHDIGKLAIPNVIRRKPGRLSIAEYETMKEHTIKGAQLLMKYAHSELEHIAVQIALTHHERWDGSGYPGHIDPDSGKAMAGYEDKHGRVRGKRGEEIPVFGRLVAIADVYDSLMNHRVFREAWKEEDVLKKLRDGANSHFDPEMIEAFFASLETIHAIADHYQNNERLSSPEGQAN